MDAFTPTTSALQPPVPRPVLSRRQAAEFLGISERLLWTLTAQGTVPHMRIGRRVLYPIDPLRRFVDDQTVGGVSPGETGGRA